MFTIILIFVVRLPNRRNKKKIVKESSYLYMIKEKVMKYTKSLLLASFAATLLFSSCAQKERLKTGDLVFVKIPVEYNLEEDSMAQAIGEATSGGTEMNVIHVAILEMEDGKPWIIDATIRHNVDRHPLDTFLKDFTLKDGSLPEFEVKRLKDRSLQKNAGQFVLNARQYLGQGYDLYFKSGNGMMYCSELVQNSYLRPDGSFIFPSLKMNFKDGNGEMPIYWEQLFERLGEKVPQGEDGTNPSQMSLDPALRTVKAAFPPEDSGR